VRHLVRFEDRNNANLLDPGRPDGIDHSHGYANPPNAFRNLEVRAYSDRFVGVV